jgi:hypothetical protein
LKSTNWKEIAELIGIAAIVASLIFVGVQFRQSEQIGISDVVANRNDRQNALRLQIIENADIWHRACIGESLESDERHVAAAIYDTYTGNILSAWLNSRAGLINSDALQRLIIEDAAIQLWAFPGLRELRDSRAARNQFRSSTSQAVQRDSRVAGLYEGIQRRLSELHDSGMRPDVDVALCGIQ